MLLTNDFSDMEIGRVRYSPMCNASGGIVDDLIVYKFAEDDYLLVVNAANKNKDAAWIRTHLTGEAEMEDQSDRYAQLALRAPQVQGNPGQTADENGFPTKYYALCRAFQVGGASPALFPAPATRGSLAMGCTAPPTRWKSFRQKRCRKRKQLGLTPVAWAPGTPCAWRRHAAVWP